MSGVRWFATKPASAGRWPTRRRRAGRIERSIRRRPLGWAVYPGSVAAGAVVAGMLTTGILLTGGAAHDTAVPIVPNSHAQQLLNADGAIRLAPAASVRWRAFPSRSCRFPVPVGWRVVWADLDRGPGWHNEARSQAGDRLTCDVAHSPQTPTVALRAASSELRADRLGAAMSVAPVYLPRGPRALAMRYRYGHADAERVALQLFLADGVRLVLDAHADDFDALQRGLLRAAGGIRSACPIPRRTDSRSSPCLLEPVLSP
jgi:hypothetical protein